MSLLKLDLNFPLQGLDGLPMKDQNGTPIMACKQMAESMSKIDFPDGALRFWRVAQELYQNGVADVEKSDLNTLRGILSEKKFILLAAAQIEDAIDKAIASQVGQTQP